MVPATIQLQQNLRLLIMSFIMSSDIETQQTVWVAYKDEEMCTFRGYPVTATTVQLANHYSVLYSQDK